ncbi:MAG: hypothetical protein JWO56_1995, partial [Acidobacteria bacterium]|nr:hypothetical protein [Acidobacteriota bacterium]
MTQRLPNALFWRLIVDTFGVTDGRGWRKAAARCLGATPADLRRRYDRFMLPGPVMDKLYARAAGHIRRRREAVRRELAALD